MKSAHHARTSKNEVVATAFVVSYELFDLQLLIISKMKNTEAPIKKGKYTIKFAFF